MPPDVANPEGQPMAADDARRWMWTEACAMIERAEGLHRQFFQPTVSVRQASWEPPVDIFETARELWIVTALPGVELPDLDVAVDGQVLVVAGLRRPPFDTARRRRPAPGDSLRPLRAPHPAPGRAVRALEVGTRARMPLCQPDEAALISRNGTCPTRQSRIRPASARPFRRFPRMAWPFCRYARRCCSRE